MQFNRQIFLDAISCHQSNLDKKAINPIFSSILLETTETSLKTISTDGQRYLEYEIVGNFEPCSFFLNGSMLYEILRKSKSESFFIQEALDSYKIIIDNAEFKFTKNNANEFPEWPNSYDHTCTIETQTLLNGLKTVKWAASTEDTRPSLHGVCLDFNKNLLNLCATDSLKLAVFKMLNNFNITGKWILGKKSVAELIKLIDDFGASEIEMSLGKSIKISAQKENSKIIWKSLCINGTFPNYERLISDQKVFNASFITNAKSFLENLERILVVSNQHQKTISLKFDDETSCRISAENALSEGEDVISGTYNGQKLKILFDGRFLQEMLNNLTGDVIFEIIDPLSPITIKKLETNNSLFVLAPIRQEV